MTKNQPSEERCQEVLNILDYPDIKPLTVLDIARKIQFKFEDESLYDVPITRRCLAHLIRHRSVIKLTEDLYVSYAPWSDFLVRLEEFLSVHIDASFEGNKESRDMILDWLKWMGTLQSPYIPKTSSTLMDLSYDLHNTKCTPLCDYILHLSKYKYSTQPPFSMKFLSSLFEFGIYNEKLAGRRVTVQRGVGCLLSYIRLFDKKKAAQLARRSKALAAATKNESRFLFYKMLHICFTDGQNDVLKPQTLNTLRDTIGYYRS